MTIRERLASFITRGMSPENPSTPLSAIAKWLNSGQTTTAGESMNETIALQIVAVMACIKVLAESVASLPCNLYEKTVHGKQVAEANPLHYILSCEPNNEMSAFTFWETLIGSCALAGNSYAEIKWTRDQSTVGELYPLHPLMTEPHRADNGTLVYRTRQGTKDNNWRYIQAEDCLHFKLFSLDGLRGISPIEAARQSLGLTRAAEKFGARLFGNGSKPGGVLTGPEDLDDKLMAVAKSAWEAAQGGSNQGRTAVLPGEWKYTQIGLSPEDSQFLATRSFQREEIAAIFRVPAHMIGDTSKISNSSYEQLNMSFTNDTIRPILTRVESELNRKLMHQVGRKANKFFARFDTSERLRADHENTMKGVSLARQWSLMTVDEGRIALGLNPIGDDSRLAPVNMMNADLITTQTQVPNGAPGGGAGEPQDTNTPTTKPKKDKAPSEAEVEGEDGAQLED